MFRIIVTGSHNRHAITPLIASNYREAGLAARAVIEEIAKADSLHADEAVKALEFWTVEQIVEDLLMVGQCGINICGGYYCVEALA